MGGSNVTLAINGATKVQANATGLSVGTGTGAAFMLDLFGSGNPTINIAGTGAYSSILNMGAAGGGSGQIKSSASLLFFANGTQGGGFDGATHNMFLGTTAATSSAILIYGSGGSGSSSFNIDETVATGYSSYRLGNGTGAPGANGAAFHYMNGSYSPAGAYYANGATLTGFGAGGLNFSAQNASGQFRWHLGTGGTLAAQIASNGTVAFLTP